MLKFNSYFFLFLNKDRLLRAQFQLHLCYHVLFMLPSMIIKQINMYIVENAFFLMKWKTLISIFDGHNCFHIKSALADFSKF